MEAARPDILALFLPLGAAFSFSPLCVTSAIGFVYRRSRQVEFHSIPTLLSILIMNAVEFCQMLLPHLFFQKIFIYLFILAVS